MVLIDERTQLQAFLQGSMRMRQLEIGQSITVIGQNNLSLEEHLAHMCETEEIQLKIDIFNSVIENIDNLIRNDLIQRLIACTTPDEQANLAIALKTYFIQTKELDLYQQYGSIEKSMSSRKILEQYTSNAIEEWLKLLTDVGIRPKSEDESELRETSRNIIEKALPQCREEMMWSATPHFDDQEHEKERQKEQQKEEECFAPKLQAARGVEWSEINIRTYDVIGPSSTIYQSKTDDQKISIHPLLCHFPQDEISFSPDLCVTSNYEKVYKNQTHMVGRYLKPIHAILFTKDPQGKKPLRACIVTNEEAEQITQILSKEQNSSIIWLSSLRHTVLAGVRPPELSGETPVEELTASEKQTYLEYQTLMEQIYYFSGALTLLADQKTPLVWLSEESAEKLRFFNEHIMPYRQTRPTDLTKLQSKLSEDLIKRKSPKPYSFFPSIGTRSVQPGWAEEKSDRKEPRI